MNDAIANSDYDPAIKAKRCRHCGGGAWSSDPLVGGVHPLCQALRSLEDLLDATDDPSIADETDRYRKTVHALLTLWERLPRGEQDKTLHFLKCELADTNRMVAEVYLEDDDNQVPAFAAMREAGLEVVIAHTFEEGNPDGVPPTLALDVYGVSKLRSGEFLGWLTALLAPFGAYVDTAGYADPPGMDH